MSAEAPQVLKDVELQRYYDALFTLYGMPGWKYLMEDVENMLKQHDSVRSVESIEELFARRGEISMMDWIATHQARSEAAYQAKLEDESGVEAEAPTGGDAKVVG